MQFFIDADLPRDIAKVLRNLGHEATDCRDVGLVSAGDKEIFAYAQEHGLVLLTGDYGFANLQTYPPSTHKGVVTLFIPQGVGRAYILELIREFHKTLSSDSNLTGCLCMVEFGRVRYRRQP